MDRRFKLFSIRRGRYDGELDTAFAAGGEYARQQPLGPARRNDPTLNVPTAGNVYRSNAAGVAALKPGCVPSFFFEMIGDRFRAGGGVSVPLDIELVRFVQLLPARS